MNILWLSVAFAIKGYRVYLYFVNSSWFMYRVYTLIDNLIPDCNHAIAKAWIRYTDGGDIRMRFSSL